MDCCGSLRHHCDPSCGKSFRVFRAGFVLFSSTLLPRFFGIAHGHILVACSYHAHTIFVQFSFHVRTIFVPFSYHLHTISVPFSYRVRTIFLEAHPTKGNKLNSALAKADYALASSSAALSAFSLATSGAEEALSRRFPVVSAARSAAIAEVGGFVT